MNGTMVSSPAVSSSSCTFKTAVASATNIRIESGDAQRLVLVRYYLDRPGYDLSNSSSRFWKNPPAFATASDVSTFLDQQGIQSVEAQDETKLLVEIFLDKFGSFMLLESVAENSVKFDFSTATPENPGILNLRLTDLSEALSNTNSQASLGSSESHHQQRCNTSPVGLFAFAMTVGLDSTNILRKLLDDGSIDGSFLLVWSPYAFFVSGLLQLLVGINEISRNNVYGATAFLAFGCFWLSNGIALLLTTYFPDEIPDALSSGSNQNNNAPDTFVREFYILVFACALFKQTLIMNKATTGMIGNLIVYLFFSCLVGWNDGFLWMKMIVGYVLSLYGLYLFYAELTNEVYQRPVINLYPWNSNSTVEAFGAAGRVNTLSTTAIDLRTAGHHKVLDHNTLKVEAATSAFHVRAVRPTINDLKKSDNK